MDNHDNIADESFLDTIVIPAHPKGFNDVFVGKRRWPNLKIDRNRIKQVKYIAVYQTKPISAITHYAEIRSFEPLQRAGRFDVKLKGEPVIIGPIPYTDADVCAVQGPRYARLGQLLSAKRLDHAFRS